jgi:hypothetical protein
MLIDLTKKVISNEKTSWERGDNSMSKTARHFLKEAIDHFEAGQYEEALRDCESVMIVHHPDCKCASCVNYE